MTARRGPALALVVATGASALGNAMVGMLVPWWLLAETGSPAMAGLVAGIAAAALVPGLVMGGPAIDRWSRRGVAASGDVASGVSAAGLAALSAASGVALPATAAVVAMGAVLDGVGASAREALRPDVALGSGRRLERVNATGEAAEEVGHIVGPVLAGVAIAAVGASRSFLLAAGVFVVAAVAAAWLPVTRRRPAPAGSYAAEAVAGVRYVWGDPVLRGVGILAAAVLGAVAPITLVLTTSLESSGRSTLLGVVLAAFAAGGIVGALTYGTIGHRLRRRPLLVGGILTAGLAIAAMGTDPPPPALVALAAAAGLAFGPVGPAVNVVIHRRVPEPLRGRALTALGSLSLVAAPAFVAGAGLLLQILSTALLFAAIGAGLALVALGVGRTHSFDETSPPPDVEDSHDRHPARP